jgi:hypothetical protein
MYDSLKSWMNVPAIRMPYSHSTGTGVRVFGTHVDFLCYPTGKVTTITDKKGDTVVSNTQLFVAGDVVFNERDHVVFEGIERPLKTINTFYRKGVSDIKVLYL